MGRLPGYYGTSHGTVDGIIHDPWEVPWVLSPPMGSYMGSHGTFMERSESPWGLLLDPMGVPMGLPMGLPMGGGEAHRTSHGAYTRCGRRMGRTCILWAISWQVIRIQVLSMESPMRPVTSNGNSHGPTLGLHVEGDNSHMPARRNSHGKLYGIL